MTQAPVTVRPYAGEREEWDGLVRRAPGGSVFHLIGWRNVLERLFPFTAHYLTARRGTELVGVLPLFELRSPFSSPTLLSLPFAVEGGVCSSDPEAARALASAAVSLSQVRGARSLELRDGLDGPDFHLREGTYYRFRRPILPTDEENLAAVRRKQRRMIRVGLQSGLSARIGTADLEVFYDLYARNLQRLGTPVFARRYFQELMREFGDGAVLLTVWHGNQPAAAVLSFFFADAVLPYYAGSRPEFFSHAVNDFMYWELMRYARERGARVFDFGRSKKGTGAYEFKCHWGFEPEPLRYRVYTRPGEPVRDRTMNSANVQVLQRIWRQLPLPLTKVLGPLFIRHYGAHYT
jgi:FemAB-related protein (PEP-CTERM system-associated)